MPPSLPRHDSADGIRQEEDDGQGVPETAPPLPRGPQREVTADAEGQRSVKQRPVAVERPPERQPHAEHGGENDRRVAEDHREDEPQEDGVEHGVVVGAGGEHVPEREQDPKDAGAPDPIERAPGDVVAEQPEGDGEEPETAQPNTRGGRAEAGHEAQQKHTSGPEKPRAAPRGQAQQPGQLQPLSRDGENEETDPPGRDLVEREAPVPEDRAADPEDGPHPHRRQIHGGLLAPEEDEDRDQEGAARRQQAPPQVDVEPGEEGEPAEPAQERRPVGPAALEGNGALQPDERAEEAGYQEWAVVGGQRRDEGKGPAQADQPAPQGRQEREPRQGHEGQPRDGHLALPTSTRQTSGPSSRYFHVNAPARSKENW